MKFMAYYRYKGASCHVPPVRRIFKAPSMKAAEGYAKRVARKRGWNVEKVVRYVETPHRSWAVA